MVAPNILIPKKRPKPIIPLDPWIRRLVLSRHRFNWINYSRQLGKSTALCIRRALRGIKRKKTQIMVSSSQRQAKELCLKAADIFVNAGILNEKTDKITAMELRGGDLRMVFCPPNPRTIRGFTGDVGWDEAAMTRDCKEVWAAIHPMTTRVQGEIDICSTPKGIKNQFYKLRQNRMFRKWTCTIDEAIEQGSTLDRDELYESCGDEEIWRQEFLCEFLDEATAYLPYKLILSCTDEDCPIENEGAIEIPPKADEYIGVDLGRTRDLTCMWRVFDTGDDVLRTAEIRTLRRTKFRVQWDVISEAIARPNVRKCVIDATYEPGLAEAAEERFGSKVEGVKFNNALKGQMAGYLKDRLEQNKFKIPHDERVIDDFHRIRRDVTSLGGVRLIADHTNDGHSDRFWAAAQVCQAASNPQSKVLFSFFR